MKRLLIACLALGAALSCHAADAPAVAPRMEVHSLAREFATFWDATQSLPEAERVQAFKTQVAAKFPAFYGVERYAGQRTQAKQDELIAHALAGFGKQRQAYLDKVDQFDAELPRHIATFNAAFPGFQPQVTTYFLHSLGEMDGGTRVLDGRNYLIFGADGMVYYHGKGNEAAFFHHELFHVHHSAQAPDCDDSVLWQRLWLEGLATHVSKVLNPEASDQEMLIDFPKGSAALIRGRIYANLAQLEQVFDSDDQQQLASLFHMNGPSVDGLPPRRGYMLGYLVAQEMGKTRSLAQLAKLSCADAKPQIRATIHALKMRSTDAAAQQ
jgi:hypothetical protein